MSSALGLWKVNSSDLTVAKVKVWAKALWLLESVERTLVDVTDTYAKVYGCVKNININEYLRKNMRLSAREISNEPHYIRFDRFNLSWKKMLESIHQSPID